MMVWNSGAAYSAFYRIRCEPGDRAALYGDHVNSGQMRTIKKTVSVVLLLLLIEVLYLDIDRGVGALTNRSSGR
jgi:hypothetical protein